MLSPDLAAARLRYIALWRHVLVGWLHWGEERFARFVAAHDRPDFGFANPMGTLHEDPLDAVAPCLIPDALQGSAAATSHRACGLEWDLVAAADAPDQVGELAIDWEASRLRVVAFLADHGYAMPGPEESTEYERRITRTDAA